MNLDLCCRSVASLHFVDCWFIVVLRRATLPACISSILVTQRLLTNADHHCYRSTSKLSAIHSYAATDLCRHSCWPQSPLFISPMLPPREVFESVVWMLSLYTVSDAPQRLQKVTMINTLLWRCCNVKRINKPGIFCSFIAQTSEPLSIDLWCNSGVTDEFQRHEKSRWHRTAFNDHLVKNGIVFLDSKVPLLIQ